MSEFDVISYTDGGCRGNPGPGGWGFMVFNPITGQALERCGGEKETTTRATSVPAESSATKTNSRGAGPLA